MRLNPLIPESNSRSIRAKTSSPSSSSSSTRPSGSAEARLESLILDFEEARVADKFGKCGKLCKALGRGKGSVGCQERLLTCCSQMLNAECSLEELVQVSSLMIMLELGPVNLSVLGSNLFQISSDPDLFFRHSNLIIALIRKGSN